MTATLVIYGAGRRDPVPLDPASIQFRAQPVPRQTCAGCLFDSQWSKVCYRAGEIARRAGLPDCGQGYVYVAVEADARQGNLFSGAMVGATVEAPDQHNQN